MTVKSYDPQQISFIFGSSIIGGFSDSDMIAIEMNEDAWNLLVGADGESTRTKNANRSASITVTLLGTSESNDVFADAAAADQLTGTATYPVLIKNNLGRELFTAATAWIKKMPNVTFGKDGGTREWMIETDELVAYVGGS